VRIAAAVGLTAFVFALAIRGGLHLGRTESGSLLPFDFFLHGWHWSSQILPCTSTCAGSDFGSSVAPQDQSGFSWWVGSPISY
jgi:hypothetical protein